MFKKRLLSLILVLSCLLALIPAFPIAAQATPNQGSGSIEFQPNPLYEGLVNPEVFTSQAKERPSTFKGESDYVSMSAAAKQLRKAMVKRSSYIALSYVTTNDDISATVHELSDTAMKHTGNPKEGDYLRFTYGGWDAWYSWDYYDGEYHVDVEYDLYYYTTAKQEEKMDDYVDDLLDDLDLYDNSDYQKIKGIYDYITETVRYDYDHLGDEDYMLQYTGYAALVNKTAVCQGYANLFYRLALELDVDARIISGDGGGPHAWNITTLDDLWYNLDATWDEGCSTYSWFLLSPDSFSRHYRDSEYETSSFHKKYPMDENDYKYDANKSNIQIDKQPKNTTVGENTTAKVTVEARGEKLKYQWYVKDPGKDSYSKSSCTKATYSAKMTPDKSGRLVYCQIKDAYGNKLKTKTVSLKVSDAVKITKAPKGAAVAEGETAKATVKATGDGLKYQWYIKDPGDDKFSKSSNTTATYSVKMSSSKSGRQVYCTITNKDGITAQTEPVTLSQITITKQAKNASAPVDSTAKVTINAEGKSLKYQWYVKNPGAEKFSKSSNTSSTYSCKMTLDNTGRQVYCKITDEYGNSVKTKTVTLTVAPKITSQPKGIAVAEGESAKVTVKATGKGLSYQWYVKDPGASDFAKSSNTSNAYSCKMSDSKSGRQVYCVITDSYGKSVTSKTVTISQITITQQPKNAKVAADKVAKATVKAEGTGLSYQWYIKNPDGSSFSKSSCTSATYSCKMTAKISGRQAYCVITDSFGNSITTNTVTLSLK